MSALKLEPNFSDADAFYAALADLHRDCDEETSERINARLILLLANHIGDMNVLRQAMAIAAEVKKN
ncbi:MAG: DUF2783 domain-containing protein [Xanthomonadaceae bacterium]|mgnify:FL=1|nr:DUF2783 domain-containing protein [Xanthomonadaceae bacterium]